MKMKSEENNFFHHEEMHPGLVLRKEKEEKENIYDMKEPGI